MYHTSPPSRILPRESSLPQYGACTLEPTVIPVISFEKNLALSFKEKIFKTWRFALEEVPFLWRTSHNYTRFVTSICATRTLGIYFFFFSSLSEPGSSGWELQNLACRQTSKYVSNEPLIVLYDLPWGDALITIISWGWSCSSCLLFFLQQSRWILGFSKTM